MTNLPSDAAAWPLGAPILGTPPRRRGRPRKDARPPGAPTTKQLILRAAAEAFASRGFDGAGLAEIAAAAGVTTSSVYSHFRGKPELLLEVVSTTLDVATNRLHTKGQSTPDALHDWLLWLIGPRQAQMRALVAEIQHAALRDPVVRELLADYGSRNATIIAAMIDRWQREGLLVTGREPRGIAQIFLTQAMGLCSTGSFQPDLLRSERFRAVLREQLRVVLGQPGD